MTTSKILGVAVFLSAAFASPVFAQEAVIGPGSRYGLEPQPGPAYYGYGPGYYRAYGFAPSERFSPIPWFERSRPGGRSTARRAPAN
jgi:hypothetical protein